MDVVAATGLDGATAAVFAAGVEGTAVFASGVAGAVVFATTVEGTVVFATDVAGAAVFATDVAAAVFSTGALGGAAAFVTAAGVGFIGAADGAFASADAALGFAAFSAGFAVGALAAGVLAMAALVVVNGAAPVAFRSSLSRSQPVAGTPRESAMATRIHSPLVASHCSVLPISAVAMTVAPPTGRASRFTDERDTFHICACAWAGVARPIHNAAVQRSAAAARVATRRGVGMNSAGCQEPATEQIRGKANLRAIWGGNPSIRDDGFEIQAAKTVELGQDFCLLRANKVCLLDEVLGRCFRGA